MPLLILLFGLFVPRVVIVLLWLLTNWFQGLFATILWPILGFIFAPTTLLWYSVVQRWLGGEFNIVAMIGFVIAILMDIAPLMRRRRVVVVS